MHLQLSDPRVSVGRISPDALQAGDVGAAKKIFVEIAEQLGWSDAEGRPFGAVLRQGGRAVVKPNLVLHENQGGHGMECLITDARLIQAACEMALASGAESVTLGDAPIQGCDFESILRRTGLGVWAKALARNDSRFRGIRDYRRTTCRFVHGVRVPEEEKVGIDDYVLFDLAQDSLLESISSKRPTFRITCYDPRQLARTHARGKHQYLVARDVIEADLVINLPKLKTHKKAGITCALKNLVGINGNKEYLPHHRAGGSAVGGDCYPGRSWIKGAQEFFLDQQNMATSSQEAVVWRWLSVQAARASWIFGDKLGVDGSWSGNDTAWRMCLDLNRILLYGRLDGTMANTPQRAVIHLADAIVAGQGEGPLAPEPLVLGVVLGARNAAALDHVGARLLTYDPDRLPIVRNAFGAIGNEYPVASFDAEAIQILGDTAALANAAEGLPVTLPRGWRDAASRRVAALAATR